MLFSHAREHGEQQGCAPGKSYSAKSTRPDEGTRAKECRVRDSLDLVCESLGGASSIPKLQVADPPSSGSYLGTQRQASPMTKSIGGKSDPPPSSPPLPLQDTSSPVGESSTEDFPGEISQRLLLRASHLIPMQSKSFVNIKNANSPPSRAVFFSALVSIDDSRDAARLRRIVVHSELFEFTQLPCLLGNKAGPCIESWLVSKRAHETVQVQRGTRTLVKAESAS